MDSGSSRKILKIGQDLLEEEQEENAVAAPNSAFTFESRFGDQSEPEENATVDDEEAWGDEEEIVEEVVRFVRDKSCKLVLGLTRKRLRR